MKVMQNELDSLRVVAGKAKAAVGQAAITRGEAQREHLERATILTAEVETRLEQAGAQRPAHVPQAPDVALRLLDTPANRRYAEKLREAWEAGLAVDRERYGESIGTDGAAQIIEMVLAQVEMEVGGPAGVLRE